MSVVNNWEVYCTDGDAYQTVWSTLAPTVCPLNHTHSISTDPGPKIIQTIGQTDVKIVEETMGSTQGYYKFRGYNESIPPGVTGNVTTFTKSWPFGITILNGGFYSTSNMVGDVLDLTAAENTVIGYITAPVYTGNTIISVNSTVIDNVAKGFYCNITDGVNVDTLGEISNIDIANSRITVTTSAENNFSPASPTYVRITVGVIDNFVIPVGEVRYSFADKKVGGKYIPPNTPIKMKYTNNEGNAKVFAFSMEYLY